MHKKLEVNLIQDDLLPKKERLTLSTTVASWMASLLLVASVNSFLSVQHVKILDEAHSLEKEHLDLVKIQEEYEVLKKSNSITSLSTESVELDKEIAIEKVKVNQIKSILIKANDPEFRVLEALSNVPSNDTWITKITKNKGLLVLEGRAMTSTAAPIWLEELKSDPFFKKLAYKGIAISNGTDGIFSFVIRFEL